MDLCQEYAWASVLVVAAGACGDAVVSRHSSDTAWRRGCDIPGNWSRVYRYGRDMVGTLPDPVLPEGDRTCYCQRYVLEPLDLSSAGTIYSTLI